MDEALAVLADIHGNIWALEGCWLIFAAGASRG